MNIFSGMGRLTRDPELKTTPSGHAVCNFTIAINRRFKNAAGEYEADFISCVAWRKTAEFISRYFNKGNMIGIIGTVQTRSWDAEDGTKRYATDVVVDQVHFCGSKNENHQPVPAESEPYEFFPGPDDDTTLPFDI